LRRLDTRQPDPVLSVGIGRAAITTGDFDAGEPAIQRFSDATDRKRRHLDHLGEQPVSPVGLELVDLDPPLEHRAVHRVHPYQQVVVLELLHDLLQAGHPHLVAHGGDVEDEHAAGVEVLVHAAEEALPGREAEQVVDALIGADDGVEPGVEPEGRHVGLVERRSRGQLRPGDGQHAGGYVQAAHLVPALVSTGQRRGDGTGAAGHVEQGRRPAPARLDATALPDEVVDERGLRHAVAGHGVIVRGQRIVGRRHSTVLRRPGESAITPRG
jgi:hypothetical protein